MVENGNKDDDEDEIVQIVKDGDEEDDDEGVDDVKIELVDFNGIRIGSTNSLTGRKLGCFWISLIFSRDISLERSDFVLNISCGLQKFVKSAPFNPVSPGNS